MLETQSVDQKRQWIALHQAQSGPARHRTGKLKNQEADPLFWVRYLRVNGVASQSLSKERLGRMRMVLSTR